MRCASVTPGLFLQNGAQTVRRYTLLSKPEEPEASNQVRQLQYTHTKLNEPENVTENDKFAVVELSGTQYKVGVDDLLFTNKLPYDIGKQIVLNNVLLVGGKHSTIVGLPYIENARVLATVEQHFRDEKVTVFKKNRRKGYQRKHGFRRDVTALRIDEIQMNN